jgi:hypothetical protein
MSDNITERKEELKRKSDYEKERMKEIEEFMQAMTDIFLLHPDVERLACKSIGGGLEVVPIYEDRVKAETDNAKD